MDKELKERLQKELKQTAKAIDIPAGAADLFIKETLKSLEKSLKDKTTITESDLHRMLAKILKKYHADFAYVYQIHDKII